MGKLTSKIFHGVPPKTFFKDLKNEITHDNVSNGAAALAYYLMFAIFPGMLFLMSLLPFLPIHNLDQQVMDLLRQALPGDSARMFTDVVREVTLNKKGGLLSFGLLATLWAASAGMVAVMQQLNITYDVREGRNFLKVRGTAIGLTILFGAFLVCAFALIVAGSSVETWLSAKIGGGSALIALFAVFRWAVIGAALLLAFAVTYYWGPDVEQKFKWITPGSAAGVIMLIVASLLFKAYVDHFGKYAATYGSIGAVIVLMLWLYITGIVIILGSEVNSLIEHYSPEGKAKGEKAEGEKTGNAQAA